MKNHNQIAIVYIFYSLLLCITLQTDFLTFICNSFINATFMITYAEAFYQEKIKYNYEKKD